MFNMAKMYPVDNQQGNLGAYKNFGASPPPFVKTSLLQKPTPEPMVNPEGRTLRVYIYILINGKKLSAFFAGRLADNVCKVNVLQRSRNSSARTRVFSRKRLSRLLSEVQKLCSSLHTS